MHYRKLERTQTTITSLGDEALKLGLTQEEADEYVKEVGITLFRGRALVPRLLTAC